MAISEFKAKCLAVLERVRKTGQPIRITRRGEPVAQIVPPTSPEDIGEWLGCMRDSGKICGDVVTPTSDLVDWDDG